MGVIFISYSLDDEGLKEDLRVKLAPAERSPDIEISWEPDRLTRLPDRVIEKGLLSVEVMVLLVSPSWLDALDQGSVRRVLLERSLKSLPTVAMILDGEGWKTHSLFIYLRSFTVLPSDGKPLNSLPEADQDRALYDVAVTITKLAKECAEESSPQPPQSRRRRLPSYHAIDPPPPDSERNELKVSFKFKKLKLLLSLSLGIVCSFFALWLIVRRDAMIARQGVVQRLIGILSSYVSSVDGGQDELDGGQDELDGGQDELDGGQDATIHDARPDATTVQWESTSPLINPPPCTKAGTSCVRSEECCIGLHCSHGFCESQCKGNGQSCAADSECCGLLRCTDSTCKAEACLPIGKLCAIDGDCCSAICSAGLCSNCRRNTAKCDSSDQCCSGSCQDGQCVCKAEGEMCSSDGQCCGSSVCRGVCRSQ